MPSPVHSVVVVGDNIVGIFVGCRGLWLVLHVYVGPGSLGTVCVGQGGFPLLCFWRSRGVDTCTCALRVPGCVAPPCDSIRSCVVVDIVRSGGP